MSAARNLLPGPGAPFGRNWCARQPPTNGVQVVQVQHFCSRQSREHGPLGALTVLETWFLRPDGPGRRGGPGGPGRAGRLCLRGGPGHDRPRAVILVVLVVLVLAVVVVVVVVCSACVCVCVCLCLCLCAWSIKRAERPRVSNKQSWASG